jgi:hypothetical protein
MHIFTADSSDIFHCCVRRIPRPDFIYIHRGGLTSKSLCGISYKKFFKIPQRPLFVTFCMGDLKSLAAIAALPQWPVRPCTYICIYQNQSEILSLLKWYEYNLDLRVYIICFFTFYALIALILKPTFFKFQMNSPNTVTSSWLEQ